MFISTSAPLCRSRRNCLPVVGCFLLAALSTLFGGCSSIAARGRNAEGVRHFRQARYDEALRQFQEAAYTDPGNPDGYYNLAATCHRLGQMENRQSKLDQAENYYHMCLYRDGNHRDAHRGLAVLLAEQGRKEDAFRLIEGWVDRRPGLADPKIELARLCEEHGEKAAAKDHLVEALKVDPDNARALAALGKIREDMGEHVQALADYRRSLLHDRFQPQVAARVAGLQSKVTPELSITVPDGGTRLVDRPSGRLR